MVEDELANVTSARGWETDILDLEWEVVIIGVVDEVPMVNRLLKARGVIAGGNEGARLASCRTLLHSSRLCQNLVVDFDSVDDDLPLILCVHSSERPHVGHLGGANVGLLLHFVGGSFDGRDGIEVCHVGVQGEELVGVLSCGLFDLVEGVLAVLETPSLGGVETARWRFVVRRRVGGGVEGWSGGVGRRVGSFCCSCGRGRRRWGWGGGSGSGGRGFHGSFVRPEFFGGIMVRRSSGMRRPVEAASSEGGGADFGAVVVDGSTAMMAEGDVARFFA